MSESREFDFAVDRFKKLIRGTIDLVSERTMSEADAKIHLEFETDQLVEGKNIIISELKQETEQLKNSQSQKQKIKLHDKILQLEADKAEMLNFISRLQEYDFETLVLEQNRLLKKHGVSL